MPRRIYIGAPSTEVVQAIDALVDVPITGGEETGVLNQDVDLTTSTTLVPHKLGHAFTGWFLTRLQAGTAGAYVWEDETAYTSAFPKTAYVALRASAACTVDFWAW